MLDEAVDELPEPDRVAVLLRFFERRSFAEIGAALRTTENTARMRTERALGKLRAALAKRGIQSSSSTLAGVLLNHASTSAPQAVLQAAFAAARLLPVTSRMPAGWTARKAGALVGGVAAIVVVAVLVGVRVGLPHRPAARGSPPPQPERSARAAALSTASAIPADAAPAEPITDRLPSATEPPPSTSATIARGGSATSAQASAVAVLEQMARAYAALETYEDIGEVRRAGAPASPSELQFRTQLRRPTFLNLRWITPAASAEPRRTSGIVGDAADTAFSSPQLETPFHARLVTNTCLQCADTHGCSYFLPSCFFAELFPRNHYVTLSDLVAPTLVGEAMVDGVRCHVVEGSHPNGGRYRLWISQDDSLLRKIASPGVVDYVRKPEARLPDAEPTFEEFHRKVKVTLMAHSAAGKR